MPIKKDLFMYTEIKFVGGLFAWVNIDSNDVWIKNTKQNDKSMTPFGTLGFSGLNIWLDMHSLLSNQVTRRPINRIVMHHFGDLFAVSRSVYEDSKRLNAYVTSL